MEIELLFSKNNFLKRKWKKKLSIINKIIRIKENHLHEVWFSNSSKINISLIKEIHIYGVILDSFYKIDQAARGVSYTELFRENFEWKLCLRHLILPDSCQDNLIFKFPSDAMIIIRVKIDWTKFLFSWSDFWICPQVYKMLLSDLLRDNCYQKFAYLLLILVRQSLRF